MQRKKNIGVVWKMQDWWRAKIDDCILSCFVAPSILWIPTLKSSMICQFRWLVPGYGTDRQTRLIDGARLLPNWHHSAMPAKPKGRDDRITDKSGTSRSSPLLSKFLCSTRKSGDYCLPVQLPYSFIISLSRRSFKYTPAP